MMLKDRVAIITGASRGLGKGFAKALAKEGANIVIAARTVAAGKIPGTIYETAEEVRTLGVQVLAQQCDVTKEENVNALVHNTLDKFGRIDILINNAAVAWWPPITETPLKYFDLVLRVNVIGAFQMVKAVLPDMINRRSGSIINISSLSANKRVRGFSGISYGVSKAALERFTWGLAAELGCYNIAANAIKPIKPIGTEGMIANAPKGTDMSDWQSDAAMVKACTFLAAQDASGVTGIVATDEEFCQWHGLI